MIGTPICLGYRNCIIMVVVVHLIQIGVAALHIPLGLSTVHSTIDIAVIINIFGVNLSSLFYHIQSILKHFMSAYIIILVQ